MIELRAAGHRREKTAASGQGRPGRQELETPAAGGPPAMKRCRVCAKSTGKLRIRLGGFTGLFGPFLRGFGRLGGTFRCTLGGGLHSVSRFGRSACGRFAGTLGSLTRRGRGVSSSLRGISALLGRLLNLLLDSRVVCA